MGWLQSMGNCSSEALFHSEASGCFGCTSTSPAKARFLRRSRESAQTWVPSKQGSHKRAWLMECTMMFRITTRQRRDSVVVVVQPRFKCSPDSKACRNCM